MVLPVRIAAALVLPLVLVGCRAAFRYPVEPYTSERPKQETLLKGMNPFILTNLVSTRVVVEIDWIEGHEPHPKAIEGIKETLREVCPPDKEIVVYLDDEIPLSEWEAASGDFLERAPALAAHLDHLPDVGSGEELIWVLFVPGRDELLGWASQVGVERDDRLSMVSTLFVFPDRIKKQAQLWIGPGRIQRAVAVHELGHELGLVSHPDHQERGNPGHCTEPHCVMAHQRLRGQFYNALPALFAGKIPDAYGDKCRADLETAQRLWHERAATDPGFVDRLGAQREIRELREQACWYGERQRWGEAIDRFKHARGLAEQFRDVAEETALEDDERFLKLYRFCPGD